MRCGQRRTADESRNDRDDHDEHDARNSDVAPVAPIVVVAGAVSTLAREFTYPPRSFHLTG
jgi:hypothetical protein